MNATTETAIPVRWTRDGIEMVQLWRSNEWAVYRAPFSHPVYDVFRIRKRKAEVAFGRSYPEREGCPSAEQWGHDAFTVTSWSRVSEILTRAGQIGIPDREPKPECPALPSDSTPYVIQNVA